MMKDFQGELDVNTHIVTALKLGLGLGFIEGVLHEEQWNEENLKENKEVLRLILAADEENTKPKIKKKGKKKKGGRGKK